MLPEDKMISLEGLNDQEVKERELKNLTNNYDYSKGLLNYFHIIIENILTPFNLINFIIIAFLLYFYFTKNDDRLLLDSVGVLIVITINIVFSVYQKIKSLKSLEQVELLKKNRVKVLRNSRLTEIENSSIVINDIILINKGDQIPVDSKVIYSSKLIIDESLITGESLQIPKFANDELLSGSYCVNGMAYIEATKVGLDSYANRITVLAKKYKISTSPLMNKINIIFTVSFLITLVLIFIESAIASSSFKIESIRKISTIAFTLIPEGLIFFTTVTIVIGIFKITKVGAIIQKMNAIDSFSTIDIICFDKTGTLTKNCIKINKIVIYNENLGLNELKKLLGTYYHFSSNKNPTLEVFSSFDYDATKTYLDEIPFDSELKYSAILLKNGQKNDVYILGSFETMFEYLNDENKNNLMELFLKNELKGFRNLIFCYIPDYKDDSFNEGFLRKQDIFSLGIISLKDEVREDVFESLVELKKMNKEIKILTGDTADSTYSVLREIGLITNYEEIYDARQIDKLSNDVLLKKINDYNYFSGLKPSQKLKIVKLLKQSNKQVCFIGDGLNDLPAIKEADLGIAMDSGVTITKEVADIVLLKNKFSILAKLFNEGNRIINTVSYIVKFYLIKNFSVFLMVLINWIFLVPFPLTPRRSSLLSALAIGLPSYFVSLKNRRTKIISNFWMDLARSVAIPSITIVLFVNLSYYFSLVLLKIPPPRIEYIMFSVFIMSSIFVFFSIVGLLDKTNRHFYLYYAFFILSIYLLMSSIEMNFFPFNVLSSFYEIEIMDLLTFLTSILFTFLCSFFIYFGLKLVLPKS